MEGAPYRLSEGLLLEKSGNMVPWFNSLHEIGGKGGKPLPEKGKQSRLLWEAETVLGGLHVSVLAMAHGSGVFFLETKHARPFESASDEFLADLKLLKQKFGEPTQEGNDNGYPWVRWRWGDICLNLALAERFTDYVAMSVSKGVIDNAL